MKRLLIIYAHWPPSNLAGVHRPRLIGNYLSEFGWLPRILTVEEKFYEETPDYDFEKTFSKDFVVTKVKAFPIIKPRIIGDIGLRAFFQLYKKALWIISKEQIDFIWIPIPSFYQAVLGRLIFNKTGVPYGIDYIDPWIRDLKGNKSIRAKLSNIAARILEPYAVKKASLITGVSYSYYQPVLERNFKNKKVENVGMPYGFDINDHKIKLNNISFPWDKYPRCKPIIYAGAFLPQSGLFVELFFKAIRVLRETEIWDEKIKFFFIGTGNYYQKSIIKYAEEERISDIVFEQRDRKPYLHILNYLNAAWRVLVIGCTAKHYTASKTFQNLLSERPVFAMLHESSSAIEMLHEANSDQFIFKYNEKMGDEKMKNQIKNLLIGYLKNDINWKPDFKALERYSAKKSAELLVEKLNKITQKSSKFRGETGN